MTIAPRIIAVLVVVGAAFWSVAVTVAENEPFATDAAVLLTIGLLMFSMISAVGLLLPRGRWARNLARAILTLELILAISVALRGWTAVALAATAAGIIGIQGRWLDGWLRRLPAAEGPGLEPMLFLLGCLALVPLAPLASPHGVRLGQGVLAATGLAIGWFYSRAKLGGLWAGRLLIAPLTLLATVGTPTAGKILTLAVGGGLVWLAWTDETRLAISPLLDRLPEGRSLPAREGPSE